MAVLLILYELDQHQRSVYSLNDSESYNFSQGVWMKKSFEIKKTGKISSLKNTF